MKQMLRDYFFNRDDNFWGFILDPEEDPEEETYVFPESGFRWTYCTGYACEIKRMLGKDRVEVWGYRIEDTEDQRIGHDSGGHNFAIVDNRYIVDPWPNEVLGDKIHYGVYDLRDANDYDLIIQMYGNPSTWEKENIN